jgi:putative DNA primase/helicase
VSAATTNRARLKTPQSAIPSELLRLQQWIAWWSVAGEGVPVKLPSGKPTKPLKKQAKPHKLPINPRTGGLASTTEVKTWSSSKDASAAVQKLRLTGIGFVFTDGDPYAGVDIDNCRNPDTGEIAEWAWPIIRSLDSYTEVSPSGTGVHIIVRGQLPSGEGNQAALNAGKVEMFSQRRYFTFTGIHVDGTPTEIHDRQAELIALHGELFTRRQSREVPKDGAVSRSTIPPSDAELIEQARSARNGSNFARLWDGQWEGAYPSQSEADLGLCSHLAFWTGNDAARMDCLFRQSGLMREKWNVQGYRERTIERAVASTASTHKSKRSGPKGRAAPSSGRDSDSVDDPKDATPDLLYFPYTDTGNAERLVRLYGGDIRFCPETKKWLVWDGWRWNTGDTRNVKRLLKKTIREFHRQVADIPDGNVRENAEKHARKSESAVSINAALMCAEYENGIATPANDFDTNSFLLNCQNGTLDLRSGQLRAHDRKDLITKLVHFNYRADAKCPLFLQFLYRIMGDNPDAEPTERPQRLVAYLQKCFGYALTGDVSEKVVLCFFGTGNNGKTTLLEIIRLIIEEHSAQVLIDTLMVHNSRETNASLADLSDLRGARYVTTSETEEGQRLAVGKLKYLTQGMGSIKACRKYENPITFPATHKLFLDANYRPAIRGAEKAIWHRLKLIPFTVTIPPEDIDKTLLGKLKAEGEGILAWMVEGCRLWIRDGLGDPPEVSEASSAWQAESDRFKQFLQEQCVLAPDAWAPVASVWPAYLDWCALNREVPQMTKTEFDSRLEEQGCKRGVRDSGSVRAWIGIRLRGSAEGSADDGDKVTRSDTESC